MKIHKGDITQSWADFIARVEAFKAAKAAHRFTIGQPAPTEADIILIAAEAASLERGAGWPEDAPPPAEPPVKTPEEIAAARIARAWADAKTLIEAQFDTYSQISATNLRMDPACPTWRSERIAAVHAWINAVWAHYAAVKQQILAGVDAHFDHAIPGTCPWTIWQIVEE